MIESFSAVKSQHSIHFTGSLDERVTQSELSQMVQLENLGAAGVPIEFDFGGVNRCNSAGIVEWLKFIQLIPGAFYYSNCPPWMVGHFNSISQFLPEQQSAVISLYAPYFSEANETNKNRLLVIGKDLELSDSYSNFPVKPMKIEGEDFVPDFDPQRYFHFLAKNKDNFQKFFSNHRIKIG